MKPAIYKQLFEFGKRLLTEKDVTKLLTNAMDMAIEISGAERGLVILFGEKDQEIRFQTARNLEKKDIENPEFDETYFAKTVSSFANTKYNELNVELSDILTTIQNILWYMDEPTAPAARLSTNDGKAPPTTSPISSETRHRRTAAPTTCSN